MKKKKEEIKNVNIIISIREADCRFLASFNNGPSRVFRTPYEILEAIGEEIDQLSTQVLEKHKDEINEIMRNEERREIKESTKRILKNIKMKYEN